MLDVIYGTHGLEKAGLSEKMWRARHEVFVSEMNWALPHKNGMERDLYDTQEAIYLVAKDENDDIRASARLLPTTMPHLMEEIFGYLVDDSKIIPKGQTVLELTRYFVARSNNRLRDMPTLSSEIFCGVMEYCVQEAITSLLIVMDTRFLPQLQEIGWTWRPLGLPQEFGGGPTVEGGGHALAVEVLPDEGCLMRSAANRKMTLPILTEAGAGSPERLAKPLH